MRVPASMDSMGELVTQKDAWSRLEVALLFCVQVTTASSTCAASGAEGAVGSERVVLRRTNSVQRALFRCEAHGHGIERERTQKIAAHALFYLNEGASGVVDPFD